MDDPVDNQFVLDSSALLIYFNNEEGAEIIEELLQKAKKKEAQLFINWLSIVEIYYLVWKQQGKDKAVKAVSLIKNLPVERIEFDQSLYLLAGELRVAFPLSLSQAFVFALAQQKEGRIVTSDLQFKKVEKEIEIFWVPPRVKKKAGGKSEGL